jgi:hypothetical protein
MTRSKKTLNPFLMALKEMFKEEMKKLRKEKGLRHKTCNLADILRVPANRLLEEMILKNLKKIKSSKDFLK